ncbi:MAG: hypothetical protein JWM26_3460, partial [Betaproteobacteria bacterium]|nr:hypothetical protein [Betaproteobacteria bacterium]
ATVYGTLVRDQSSVIVSGERRFGEWSRSDRLLFAASVATALVVGVIIALV